MHVSVKGHPHLIPEAEYWDFFFRTEAGAAEQNAVGPGEYNPQFVSTLQDYTLKIPARYIPAVLNLTRETVQRLDSLRAVNAGQAEEYAAVLEARDQLIRTLPPNVWIQLNRIALEIGGTYSFPPTI